jgi:hypothetical protein
VDAFDAKDVVVVELERRDGHYGALRVRIAGRTWEVGGN